MGKVLVLGATGGTGRQVVEVALERGWEVTAFVRDPALAGHDAVISTLGQQRGSPPDLLRSAADALLPAMARAGVQRLVVLSGAGVNVPGDPPPPLAQRLVVRLAGLVMASILADTQGYADRIRASDVDWTLARPMRLTDGPGGRPVQAAPTLALGFSSTIDRRDLAGFLVDQLSSDAFVRQAPMVTSG